MFLELCVEKENKDMVNYMISRANNAIVVRRKNMSFGRKYIS